MSGADPVSLFINKTAGQPKPSVGASLNIAAPLSNLLNFPNAEFPNLEETPDDPVYKLLNQGKADSNQSDPVSQLLNQKAGEPRKSQTNGDQLSLKGGISSAINNVSEATDDDPKFHFNQAQIPTVDDKRTDSVAKVLLQTAKKQEPQVNNRIENANIPKLDEKRTDPVAKLLLQKAEKQQPQVNNRFENAVIPKTSEKSNDPISNILNQGKNGPPPPPVQQKPPPPKPVEKYKFENAVIPTTDPENTDTVSCLLRQGVKAVSDETPIMQLLRKSSSKAVDELFTMLSSRDNNASEEHIIKGNEIIEQQISQNPDNPVVVLGEDKKDDDEDDGQPITLSVRQPSFSNLKGHLIPKGASATTLESLEEKPQSESKGSKLEKGNASAKNSSKKSSNPVIVAGEENHADDDAPIGLSVRQPSYSNLHGALIPKGAKTSQELPSLDEEKPKETKKEEKPKENKDDDDDDGDQPITLGVRQMSFSRLHGPLIPKGSTTALQSDQIIIEESAEEPKAAIKEEDEDSFADEPEELEPVENITLSVRQPSYSNLHGNLIPKGSTHTVESKPDTIIVAEQPSHEKREEILLDEITKKDQVQGEILRSLHKINTNRWKELGYDPVTGLAIDENQLQKSGNGSYVKFIEVQEKEGLGLSSKSTEKAELIVEMPNSGYNSSSEKTDDLPYDAFDQMADAAKQEKNKNNEVEDDDFSESFEDNTDEEAPMRINSAGERRKQSQIFDILPKSMQNKNQKNDDKASQKSTSSKPKNNAQQKPKKEDKSFITQPDEKLPSKPQKTYNNAKQKSSSRSQNATVKLTEQQQRQIEEGESRMPPNLQKMVTHPKDSVTYIAMCGASIIGYKKKVVDETVADIKKYVDKCIKNGYIEDAMYLDNILSQIATEKEQLKVAHDEENEKNIEERIEFYQNEIQSKETQFQQQEIVLDAQLEVDKTDLEMKKEEALQELENEWNSEKMIQKYNKPSPQLIEMRQTALRLMNAHRFEEAALLSAQIQAREEEEAAQAGYKMGEDYKLAVARVEKKFENDMMTMQLTHEKRKNNIKGELEKSLIPVKNRLAYAQHEKDVIQHKKVTEARKERASMTTYAAMHKTKPQPKIKIPTISTNKKLTLPPLKPRPQSSLFAK